MYITSTHIGTEPYDSYLWPHVCLILIVSPSADTSLLDSFIVSHQSAE